MICSYTRQCTSNRLHLKNGAEHWLSEVVVIKSPSHSVWSLSIIPWQICLTCCLDGQIKWVCLLIALYLKWIEGSWFSHCRALMRLILSVLVFSAYEGWGKLNRAQKKCTKMHSWGENALCWRTRTAGSVYLITMETGNCVDHSMSAQSSPTELLSV